MEFLKFEAGRDDNDRRIDKVIRIFCPEINLSSIYKFLRKGLIKVNDKKVSADYRIQTGDIIKIAQFIVNSKDNEKHENKSETQENSKASNFTVVFKNKDLLAINKPYNQLVHGNPTDKNPSLEEIIKNNYQPKSTSLAFTPGPLHRLDKKTTGLLFFSQSLEGARWFSENLRNHQIQKKYIGIVQGKLQEKQIWIDEISKDDSSELTGKKNNFHTVNIQKTENSKTAETEATPLFYGNYKGTALTVVEYFIKTGRTHQIRSQSSAHGFPLIGDTAYNGKKLENESRDFYLHAQKIIFLKRMPVNDFPDEINCNLDEDFIAFLRKTCDKQYFEL